LGTWYSANGETAPAGSGNGIEVSIGEGFIGGVTSNVAVTFEDCVIGLTGSINIPDVDIPNLNISCVDGFTEDNETITVEVGEGFEGEATSNLQVVVDNDNCAIGLSGSITIPDVNIPCPNGFTEDNETITVEVGEGFTGTASSNLQVVVDNDNCAIGLSGSITIPDVDISNINIPDIPCQDGISTGAETYTDSFGTWYSANGNPAPSDNPGNGIEVSVGSGFIGDVTSNVSVTFEDCVIGLTGSINIPDVDVPNLNIPCPDGISTGAETYTDSFGTWYSANGEPAPAGSGNGIEVSVGSGFIGDVTSNVAISVEDCMLSLTGSINIPDVDVPNLNISCVDGFTEDNETITVEVGEGFSGTASSDLAVSVDNDNCSIGLSGSITIPDVDIPSCEDATGLGYLCSTDYAEETLQVCQSDGTTTTITVLVKV
jgi:hypothetical protein